MVEFISSPLYDNWFKRFKNIKSIIICSPYIKSKALDEIIRLYDVSKDTSFQLLLRGNTEEFVKKSSDREILDKFLDLESVDISNIKRVTNLHMKAYLVNNDHLLITSGNLTNSGIFVNDGTENFEGGIYTTDRTVIESFLTYFNDIWSQGQNMEDFYDEIMAACQKYYETEYSEKDIVKKINKNRYRFAKKTVIEDEKNADNNDLHEDNEIYFTLSDIPSTSSFDYLATVLDKVYNTEDGIRSIDLGKMIRIENKCEDIDSSTDNAKMGEEKSKFAEFFGLVDIEKTKVGNVVKPNRNGRMYISMTDEGKKNYIKDIFFSKSIIVSIFKEKQKNTEFDLLEFLKENCFKDDGTRVAEKTLLRKVAPIKRVFSYIENMCDEDELKKLLNL